MNDYEIIIAGGGPIGCFIAKQLSLKGIEVAILEEHNTIGEPLHCAGLVTQRAFHISNCSQTGIVENKIYGAHIHGPDGSVLTIGGKKIHAFAINRQRFDQLLAQSAQSAGAHLFISHKIIGATKQDIGINLSISHNNHIETSKCSLLIGADGSHSKIRKIFGFPKPIEILNGIGAELSNTSLEPHFVHIFLGQNIAPGFFAWIIPTNQYGTKARIGLCIKKQNSFPLQHYFNNLLQQPLLHGATVMKQFGGTIPLGSLKRTVDDHVMLVGDSAAQVKPTSGGGIYFGLLCATHCVRVTEIALQKQKFTEQLLKLYHMQWTNEIGREIFLGMQFRKIFTHLTDAQINKYLGKLNTQQTIDVINSYGDIDYPSQLALPLLKTTPSLLSLTPALLRYIKKQKK